MNIQQNRHMIIENFEIRKVPYKILNGNETLDFIYEHKFI